jgi:hypothetical protein
VFEIAKFLACNSDIGREFAQEIIDAVHNGKYGSKNVGIWVQYENMLEIEEARRG